MRRIVRSSFWLIVILAIGAAALGLYNTRRGLPPLSLAGVAALSGDIGHELRETLDPNYARRLGRQAMESESPNARLRALRAAIGCFKPGTADLGGNPLNTMIARGVDKDPQLAALDLDPGDDARGPRDGGAFNLDVSIEDGVMPASFEARVRAGAQRTYDVWEGWLGPEALVHAQINLRLIGDAERFTEFYGRTDKDEWVTTGFYRIRSNEAVVLYTPQFRRTALSTAYHEISHLITAWQLGPTPPWLNEGIAEHFETMRLDWSTSQFPLSLRHLAVLKETPPIPVEELTRLSRRDWGAQDPHRRYASAWALLSFLQGSRENMETLRHVLREANAQRCSTPADLRDALATYPGGFPGLDADLQRWLSAQLRYVSVRRS